jgi:hypothetical protein
MLERTAETEVAGSWRTRGYQGNWWLATKMNYSGNALPITTLQRPEVESFAMNGKDRSDSNPTP